MGSIRGFCLFVFLLVIFPLNSVQVFAQNSNTSPPGALSLGAEISRLESFVATPGASPGQRYDAYMNLQRLYQLSGNPEAALKACGGALAAAPGDGRALLEQARLLLSLGEYERAAAALNAISGTGQGDGLFLQARYLGALLEAFRSGNTQPLALLVADPAFAGYLGGIYYALWKLTGLSSWKTRLTAEFPQSPEAKIAAAPGAVDSAPTPFWLLFPGRDSITLSPGVLSPAPSLAPSSSLSAPLPDPSGQAGLLQTGLFSREENAKAMADRLKKAGFVPQILKRQVNGSDYWSVTVSGGKDMNAAIAKLKDAGFESFPVKP